MTEKNSMNNAQKKVVQPLNVQEMIIIPLIIGVAAFVLAKLISFLF